MDAPWAHTTSLKEAPLPAAMPLHKDELPSAPLVHAPLASTVGLAQDGASLRPLTAVRVLAPAATSV